VVSLLLSSFLDIKFLALFTSLTVTVCLHTSKALALPTHFTREIQIAARRRQIPETLKNSLSRSICCCPIFIDFPPFFFSSWSFFFFFLLHRHLSKFLTRRTFVLLSCPVSLTKLSASQRPVKFRPQLSSDFEISASAAVSTSHPCSERRHERGKLC
jgi:hypothetical protein